MLPLTGSVFARILSTGLTAPLENAATLIMDGQRNNLKLSSNKSALFTGLSSMMGHEIALTSSWWMIYHNSFLFFKSRYFSDSESDVAPALISSVLSSLGGAILAHPFDLARVMKVLDPQENVKKSTFSIVRSMMKQHGAKSILIGIQIDSLIPYRSRS